MRKPFPLTLLPLCCLAMAASAAHLFNKSRERSVAAPEAPAVVAHPMANAQVKQQLEEALHQIVLAYHKEGFRSLKERTTEERWRHWQTTTTGVQVEHRMKLLASWPQITLREPQVRPSGFTETLATCGGEQLKVWMAPRNGSWKLIGIVAPPPHE